MFPTKLFPPRLFPPRLFPRGSGGAPPRALPTALSATTARTPGRPDPKAATTAKV